MEERVDPPPSSENTILETKKVISISVIFKCYFRYCLNCVIFQETIIVSLFQYLTFNIGRPYITYIDQLCSDTGCTPEELPTAMND